MDADRAQRILKAITVVSFAVALVALVGELRGWWNELGEITITVATIVGAFGGIATLLVGSTSDEVRHVGGKVGDVRDAVDANGATLASVDGKLDKLDKLDVVEEALIAEDEGDRVSKLDLVQTELDRQTGVLGRQVSILQEIRDGL